jgi:E3 ubiquitin-protein ligase listerin
MRTFESWITSDDDINEEVESVMTLIFYHFAPILQGLQGKHWDSIFDIVENNLEVCCDIGLISRDD